MPNEPRLLTQAEVAALERNAFQGFNQSPTAVLNLVYTLRETQRLAGADNQKTLPETCGCWTPETPFHAEECRYPEALRRIAEARKALGWCLENLGSGVEWGGPFDDGHLQGVHHCIHCDARWKPEGDGSEHHQDGCELVKVRAALGAKDGE